MNKLEGHGLYTSVSVILSSPVGPFTTCLACATGADWEFSQLQHKEKIRFRALEACFYYRSNSTSAANDGH